MSETRFVVPEIHFPEFPDPNGFVEMDDETGVVFMPLDFYIRIFEYKVRVDEAERVYERVKGLYEGTGDRWQGADGS